ncbi:hypothetical protein DUNSADRAFT_4987 [Dunaliella salina]|uniref:Encoded protein n=1 Tax=Dunaliella salina TaxID=3046 RepID=A0ABQ7GQZ3_DUNSA|nr:hypothetical protein DUNSADRAFT_4987 [Dunaliella salina]|eukprot:KAF5837014.1 hypothetical protein DUNSADRAFT_4987 [Dunaliella salina]
MFAGTVFVDPVLHMSITSAHFSSTSESSAQSCQTSAPGNDTRTSSELELEQTVARSKAEGRVVGDLNCQDVERCTMCQYELSLEYDKPVRAGKASKFRGVYPGDSKFNPNLKYEGKRHIPAALPVRWTLPWRGMRPLSRLGERRHLRTFRCWGIRGSMKSPRDNPTPHVLQAEPSGSTRVRMSILEGWSRVRHFWQDISGRHFRTFCRQPFVAHAVLN